MKVRTALLLGLTLLCLSGWLAVLERRAARSAMAWDSDLVQLSTLLDGDAALRASVLEARAGLDWSCDAINHALSVERGAATHATTIAARGPGYHAAADALSSAAAELENEEGAVETFKTDLALMRLSARNFPLAVDELIRDVDATHSAASTSYLAALAELRGYVERYQDAPTRDAARGVEVAMGKLEAMRANAGIAQSAELDVLLGHVRVILERRERLDEVTRTLVRSPVRLQLEAARAAYERAARPTAIRLAGLRIAATQLALAGVLALIAAAWLRLKRVRTVG